LVCGDTIGSIFFAMTSLHSIAALLFATSLHAAEPLKLRQWDVAGVRREALVHVPARAATNPVPIIFAFHGHGGTMRHAARVFDLHNHWPDALIVYMQGLNTPGQLTDPEGREPGWQKSLGDQNDRDLKFVDAVVFTRRVIRMAAASLTSCGARARTNSPRLRHAPRPRRERCLH
jgi:hypothetical protein